MNKMKFLPILMMLIMGCSSTVNHQEEMMVTTWDGESAPQNYIVYIQSKEKLTSKLRIEFVGEGESGSISTLMAQDLNAQLVAIDEKNTVRFSLGSYPVGGTFIEKNGKIIESSTSPKVKCNIYLNGALAKSIYLSEIVNYEAPFTYSIIVEL